MLNKEQGIFENNEFTAERKEKEEPKKVKKIEKAPLAIDTKIEVLLVWKGEKMATEIQIDSASWKEGEEPESVDPKKIKKIEELAKDLELFYNSSPEKTVHSEYYHKDSEGKERPKNKSQKVFYLAKTEKALYSLMEAIEEDNDDLLGQLYGYPDSAISGYKKEEIKEIIDLPSEIQNKPEIAFTRFKLSKDNWQEELQTGKKWSDTVKRVSPRMHKEFISYMRNINLGDKDDFYVDFFEEKS